MAGLSIRSSHYLIPTGKFNGDIVTCVACKHNREVHAGVQRSQRERQSGGLAVLKAALLHLEAAVLAIAMGVRVRIELNQHEASPNPTNANPNRDLHSGVRAHPETKLGHEVRPRVVPVRGLHDQGRQLSIGKTHRPQ